MVIIIDFYYAESLSLQIISRLLAVCQNYDL